MTETIVDPDRFERAIAAIDAANAQDPTRITYQGSEHPKEALHASMMTEWLLRLDPGADECQQLAARAHHFRRWTAPREEYPEGRSGYLRWRADAKRRHAAEVGELLAAEGYSADEIERVGRIIRKEARTSDPAVQTHEDALCVVFLDTQLDAVTDRLGEDAMLDVLVRTIPKLSPAGVQAAMSLDLGPRGRGLLERAAAGG